MLVLVETDRVEDVELGLGPEVRGVGDPRSLQVSLRLLRDVAGVAGVELAGDRVLDERVHDQRRVLAEGVHYRGVRVRNEDHVGFLDLLEAADRGPIEAVTLLERLLRELLEGHREVLHEARQVREPDVYELSALLLAELQRIGWSGWHIASSMRSCR